MRILFILVFTLLITDSHARDPLKSLEPEDLALIQKIDQRLNNQRTLQARFVQLNPDGLFVEGLLSIHRPNQARFEYDHPAPLLLIASGNFLIEVDRELEQVTHIPQTDSIATYLLGEDLLQNPGLTILSIAQEDGVIRIKLEETDAPENGQIILEFDDGSFDMRRWHIFSDTGNTVLTLVDPVYNLTLDENLFSFHAPKHWSVEQ